MTQEELEQQIDRAVAGFSSLEGVDEELANRLVGEGYLSYDDLSVIEPEDLMEMGNLSAEQVEKIVAEAEARGNEEERRAAEEKRLRRQSQVLASSEESPAADANPIDDEDRSPVGRAAGAKGDDVDVAADSAGPDSATGISQTLPGDSSADHS
jgi:N utilization substance protein A